MLPWWTLAQWRASLQHLYAATLLTRGTQLMDLHPCLVHKRFWWRRFARRFPKQRQKRIISTPAAVGTQPRRGKRWKLFLLPVAAENREAWTQADADTNQIDLMSCAYF